MDSIDYRQAQPGGLSWGYLIVTARTANEGLPVEGAYVTVSILDGEESAVVATAITDNAGMTEKIRLSAPPKYLSEKPDPVARPYSLYSIETSRENYLTVINDNVPIYSEITSVQPVAMIPVTNPLSPYLYDLTRFNESDAPEL